MTTLPEAYRIWVKRYPNWKMERAIYQYGETHGYVLMDSVSQRRKVFVHARVEYATTLQPIDQSVQAPEFIVGALALKEGRIPLVIAARGRFFEVDPHLVHRSYETKRESSRTEEYTVLRFTLSRVKARDITETMTPAPEVVQGALELGQGEQT